MKKTILLFMSLFSVSFCIYAQMDNLTNVSRSSVNQLIPMILVLEAKLPVKLEAIRFYRIFTLRIQKIIGQFLPACLFPVAEQH